MATKNAVSAKSKLASKSSPKANAKAKGAKPPVKTPLKPEKSSKSTKVPAAKSILEVPPEAKVATPKIMTAMGKEKSKKKTPAAVQSSEMEKVDAEWSELMNQNKSAKPVPYSMSEDFQPKTVISHKVLGVGFVLKSQNNRIEVAFKEGKKTLITNYKK